MSDDKWFNNVLFAACLLAGAALGAWHGVLAVGLCAVQFGIYLLAFIVKEVRS